MAIAHSHRREKEVFSILVVVVSVAVTMVQVYAPKYVWWPGLGEPMHSPRLATKAEATFEGDQGEGRDYRRR